MSMDSLTACHPYKHLRQFASPSFFLECISTKSSRDENINAENDGGIASSFWSKVEEALEYCFHRTVPVFAPAYRSDDAAFVGWLVDWEPIIGMIRWRELFLDHNNSSRKASMAMEYSITDDHTPTALRGVCLAIQNVVWEEHIHRLNRLLNISQVPRDHLSEHWNKLITQFHDAQLRALQKVFLDIWIENDTGIPSHGGDCYYDKDTGLISVATENQCQEENSDGLSSSDLFMFNFMADQLTKPFLQLESMISPESFTSKASKNTSSFTKSTSAVTAIWSEIIQKYTQSLCCDIRSLTHPSKLNPIANILYPNNKPAIKGTDEYTRIKIFRILTSKIRRWAELLSGLQRQKIVVDDAYDPPGIEKTESVLGSEEQGMLSKAAYGALICLARTLEGIGALNLLTPTEQKDVLANPTPLGVIRSIDESRWTQIETMVEEKLVFASSFALHVTDENGRTKKLSKTKRSNQPCPRSEKRFECLDPIQDKVSGPAKNITAARCIIKGCRNIGKLSDGGVCEHHYRMCRHHNPFRWGDEIPRDIGLQIMKRLRRRRMGLYDNLHGAIIEEIRRISDTNID